jgi:hypothetical protein
MGVGQTLVGHPDGFRTSAPVVVAAGSDADLVAFGDLVDEPMFLGDPSRPVTREVVLERLRLADAFIAVADHVLDQLVDPSENPPVLGLPPQVVLPSVRVPDEFHRSVGVKQIVTLTLRRFQALHGVQKAPRVGRRAHKVSRFAERLEVLE